MKFILFGDSHFNLMKLDKKLLAHSNFPKELEIRTHVIYRATILGLGRRKSTLQVADKIKSLIQPSTILVFGFGQVDLELGYYYRKVIKKENISFPEFIERLNKVYFDFLDQLNSFNSKIIIKGLNLTTLRHNEFTVNYVKRIITENISDEKAGEKYLALLREKIDSFEDRNKATLQLNSLIASSAAKRNWGYFDINDYLSGGNPLSGIKSSFIPGTEDHHVIDSIEVRETHLNKMLNEYERLQTLEYAW